MIGNLAIFMITGYGSDVTVIELLYWGDQVIIRKFDLRTRIFGQHKPLS